MQRLRAQSLFPMSVVDTETSKAAWTSIALPVRVTKEQISDFCAQLADLLSNGVPMLESLRILADASDNSRLKEITMRIHDAVAEGDSLDVAMGKESQFFRSFTLSMVRAGQEGAFLEEALQRTAHFLRKQDEMRSKIIGALTYPIILESLASLLRLRWWCFLYRSFSPFSIDWSRTDGLPVITVILLGTSHVLMHYGLFVLLASLGSGPCLLRLFQIPSRGGDDSLIVSS